MLTIISTLLKAMTHPYSLTITSLGLSLLKGYNTLQILQNKAAKIILHCHLQSSASEALDSLCSKPLHLRRRFPRCTTIFKCLNGFIDFNFHFVRNNTIHNYNRRSRDDFHLPHVRTNLANNVLRIRVS